MSFQGWLKALQALASGKLARATRRRAGCESRNSCTKLLLEVLEDRLAPIATTTALSGQLLGGAPLPAAVVYGTVVTFTATVAPVSGTTAPALGSVDFQDGATDLGVIATDTVSGSNAIFTLITTLNQLKVIQANGGVHTITATYSPGANFTGSAGTLAGGLKVTPAPLTITATTNTKTYDSTTVAAATPTVSGLIGNDTATGLTEVYANANAGSAKTLSVSAYIVNDGNGGLDYTVTKATNTTGVVGKASLTITATTNTKIYDATTTAAAMPTVSGLIGNGTVTGLAEVYSDKNAASGKTLSVSAYVVNDGNSGGNYTVTLATNNTGVVTAQAITVTATTNTKMYDGTNSAAAVPTIISGTIFPGDKGTFTETSDNKNAGTGKILTPTGSVNDGNGGNNYTVAFANVTTGVISARAISVTAAANSKGYDGTNSAAATPIITTGNLLFASDLNLGQIYELDKSTGALLQTIQVAQPLDSLIFDGQGDLIYSAYSVGGVGQVRMVNPGAGVSSDVFLATVGNHAVDLALAPGGNFVLVTSQTTGKIYQVNLATPGQPVVTFGSGQYSAGITYDNSGRLFAVSNSNIVQLNPSTFSVIATSAALAGLDGLAFDPFTGKLVAASRATNSGSGREGFYELSLQPGSFLTATLITQSSFPTTFDPDGLEADGNGNLYFASEAARGDNKIYKYDLIAGKLTALTNALPGLDDLVPLVGAGAGGLVPGDTANFTETYDNGNAGTGKTLIPAGSVNDGNGGNNYIVTTVTTTTGVINKAALKFTAITNTKPYDASTTAAATPTVLGLIGNDSVTGLTEVYASKNAGSGKTLVVSSYLINDGNSGGNYTVTTATNTTGVINNVALTISAVTNTKNVDGTNTAAAIPTVSGLQGNDTVTGLSESYDTELPGSGKTLSVNSGYTVNDGNNGNNYTLTTAANTTGVIIGVLTNTSVATSQASVAYGTPVTFTIMVTAQSGTAAPTGNVEVFDNGSHDLGAATFVSSSGLVSTWTLSTLPKTLNVSIPPAAPAHVITANFTAVVTFGNSSGTLVGGQTVTAAPLTITAVTNTKTYDSTSTAAATPTVSGLVAGDTVTNLTELYANSNAAILYATSTSTQDLYSVNTATHAATAIFNTGNDIDSLFIDPAGRIVYDEQTIGKLLAYDPSNQTNVLLASGLSNPKDVVLEPNLTSFLVSDSAVNSVYRISLAGGVVGSPFNLGLRPDGITYNISGQLFVNVCTTPGTRDSNVEQIDPVTGAVIASTATLAKPNTGVFLDGLTYDTSTGMLFASDSPNSRIAAINPTTLSYSFLTPTGAALSAPDGISADGLGNLFIASRGNSHILKYVIATNVATVVGTISGLDDMTPISGLGGVPQPANVGTGLTLSVSGFVINDGNGGRNYTATTVTNTTGVITTAPLTITVTTNTKLYDATTTAAAMPIVSGLMGNDTVTGLTEIYANANPGPNKTLSVGAYTVNDGNSGKNYTVTTTNNTTGLIIGPFSQYLVRIVGSNTVVAGSSFNFTVQATDVAGDPVASYSGPASVTTNTSPVDPQGNFPISGLLQISSLGFGFFLGNFKTVGTYTLTVGAGGFSGTSAPISVLPAYADYFTVATPVTAITGIPTSVTVTARDHYGNVATGYIGTVQLNSTDGAASLGNAYTFTTSGGSPDNGVHTFGVTLMTPGNQVITAVDTSGPIPTGTSASRHHPRPEGHVCGSDSNWLRCHFQQAVHAGGPCPLRCEPE